MSQDGQDLTQRVRIGLTGLACVFLLVLLGAILVKFVNDSEANRLPEHQTMASSGGDNAANGAEEQPKEPLAELGIAPGNAPPENSAPPANGKRNPSH